MNIFYTHTNYTIIKYTFFFHIDTTKTIITLPLFDPNVVPSSDATIPYAPWEKIDTMKGPSTYIFSVGVDATRDYGWAANNGHRDRGARQIKDRMKRHNNNNR